MAVSKRLRYEILRRDNYACRYCGATAPEAKLNVDHVIPQALGGSDHPTNLVTACSDCNGGKTSSMPGATTVADVPQDTFRQAATLQEEEEQRRLITFVHLAMVWEWAWEKTGQPTAERHKVAFAEETNKVLACGMAATSDLTEAAFRAGSDNAIDIAAYIGHVMRASTPVLSANDARFVTCVDAISAWEEAWDQARPDTEPTPPLDVANRFIAEVAAAFDAGTDPAALVRAAEAAGLAMSADLRKYLSEPTVTGGDA